MEIRPEPTVCDTPPSSARGESDSHRQLKRLAVDWAFAQGYRAVGKEVRLPRSGFRADIAAYRLADRVGSTAVFECKQSRSDFLKDSRSQQDTLKKLEKLFERRQTLERLLRIHEPSLRKGESLFVEFDTWDFERLNHATYRRVLRAIAMLQNRLYDNTKFERVVRYQCANLNYLVALPGIFAAHEVPVGWGLLIATTDGLELRQRPVWQDVAEPVRVELLYRIAIAGARELREPSTRQF